MPLSHKGHKETAYPRSLFATLLQRSYRDCFATLSQRTAYPNFARESLLRLMTDTVHQIFVRQWQKETYDSQSLYDTQSLLIRSIRRCSSASDDRHCASDLCKRVAKRDSLAKLYNTQERWGAGVEYHFQEFNEPYAPS